MSAYTNLQKRIERVKAEPYGRKSFMVRVDEVAELADLVREQHEALDLAADYSVGGCTCNKGKCSIVCKDCTQACKATRAAIQHGIKAGVGEAQ